MAEASLYDRLGGVFAIAAVVEHFSDAVVRNRIVGQGSANPELNEWHTKELARLPGLKWMRTLWVCNVAGGPFQYVATKPGDTTLGLEEAHRGLRISPDEFTAAVGRPIEDRPRFDAAVTATARSLIQAADRHRKGVLDPPGYARVTAAYGASAGQATRAFARLDLDRNGVLDAAELTAAITQFFTSPDPDAPGNLAFGRL